MRANRPFSPSRLQPVAMASWRSGYAEDCKSLHPGSIPGEASIAGFFAELIMVFLIVWDREAPVPRLAVISSRHTDRGLGRDACLSPTLFNQT